MSMWALGSTECSSKKEMEQPSQELSERIPLQVTPSQTPRHSLPPLSLWNIVYHNHLTPFSRSFFESAQPSISQSTHYSQKIISGPHLSQDKQKEIRSMINYLGPTSNRLPNTSSSTPHALLHCFLSSLAPSHPIAIKVNSFFPQSLPVFDLSQQPVCRKKQILCFSNKWRQTQEVIYVLMHSLPKTNKQQPSIRAHFLNQRGLLLQTAINLEPASFVDQILNIVKKHYRKAQQILIIRESNEIDMDTVLKVRENIQECTVGAISVRERKTFWGFGEKSQGELFQVEGAAGVFGYLFEKEDVAMVTTGLCEEDIKHHLSRVSGILKRESQVACELLKQDYFSSFFNRKQILLRLFAFYFNFLALEPMLPLNKDDLLDRITTSELFSHKQAQNDQFRQETVTSHTFSAHGCSLYCQVCRKRTKIICEKCCMNLNRFFGLCQKNCFQMYHQHIDQYNEQPKTNKKNENVDSDQGFSSQIESELSGLSSRGRKRVKKIQRLMEDGEESLDLEEKWGEILQTENQDYSNLVRYSMAGLVPRSVIRKIDHLKMRLNQLAFLNSTGHKNPKQEEDAQT